MTNVIDQTPLGAAKAAFSRHAWSEAFERFRDADGSRALDPDDLESYAEAAWWSGHVPESVTLRERAYAARLERGEIDRAAFLALDLARDHAMRRDEAIAMAWLSRAERALAGEPRWPAHAYLALARTMVAFDAGDLQRALDLSAEAVDLATRFASRDALAMALMARGKTLVARGEVHEGMKLVDEATVAAVSGEIGLMTTGWIYCNTISTCRDVGDLRRAGEWTDAAHRWCERQSVGGFPGVCRVHRAEIIALRGSLAQAEQEARRACDELSRYQLRPIVSDGFYEIGEIRLRMGDLAAAEEAIRQAHEMGHSPQPALALVRLAQGRPDVAHAALRRALAEERAQPTRARMLPAAVEVAIAAGELDDARTGAAELSRLATSFEGPTIAAAATTARGRVRLAEGDTAAALGELRDALREWQMLEMPYEAATARVLIAKALRAAGEEDAARLELGSAKATFERIGAVRDARQTAALLGDVDTSAAAGPRVRRTFVFSDIVNSTSLIAAIGDEAWHDLIRWHDETLRSVIAEHGGEEIRHQGDGLVFCFAEPAAAIACAVAIQRRLAEHRRAHGFAPQVRLGLHTADATQRGLDYAGMGIHEAARIGALASAGEIVASEDTIASGGSELALGDARTVELKGIPGPVRVRTILWR